VHAVEASEKKFLKQKARTNAERCDEMMDVRGFFDFFFDFFAIRSIRPLKRRLVVNSGQAIRMGWTGRPERIKSFNERKLTE